MLQRSWKSGRRAAGKTIEKDDGALSEGQSPHSGSLKENLTDAEAGRQKEISAVWRKSLPRSGDDAGS